MRTVTDLPYEKLHELLVVYAKNWLAHDGCWFINVEQKYGHDAAVELDEKSWGMFTVSEAARIKEFLGLGDNGGLPALAEALGFRMFAQFNRNEVVQLGDDRLVYKFIDCRVQQTRTRKGLPRFNCHDVGVTEFSGFAREIDPRIETRCLTCPPHEKIGEFHCLWEFTIEKD